MAASLKESSEVVRAWKWIAAPGGNGGACDLVRYAPDLGHALGTLTLTLPSYHFDSRDKASKALLQHLEICCCRASEVQQPIELWTHASISIGFQWIPSLRSSHHAHQNRSFSRDPSQEMPGRGC